MSSPRRTVMLHVKPTAAESAMHDALLAYARLVWRECATAGLAGARLAMSVLMRRASSSAASLARSVERRLALLGTPAFSQPVQASFLFADEGDDAEPDALLGAAGLSDRRDERAHLEHVLVLARLASAAESKLTTLRRFLVRAREPAIVFTEYRDTLQQVAASLPAADAVQLHGGLTPRERADVLGRFVRGGARLLLATDAASEGLNLHQRCRLVINLELPWTPLRLEQRAGRIDRIGQRRRVHAVHLVAAGTSEEHVLAKLADRRSRTDDALKSLGRLPGEREVAECVLANGVLPDAVPRSASPPIDDVQVADLAHEANQEAARIIAARALLEPCDDPAETRPVLTRVRTRRRGRSGPQCYWLFRLLLAASDGRIAATGYVPLGTHGIPWLSRSHAATRLLLDPESPAVREIARPAAAALAAALASAARAHFRLRMDRERALARELRDRQARLSSRLLQPGLFDHRHERAAAAQASLLESALAASALRIAHLTATETLHVDACDLIFAVVLE